MGVSRLFSSCGLSSGCFHFGGGGVHYSNLGSVQEGMHGKWKVRDSRGHGREVAKAVVLVTDLHSY